MPAPHVYLDHAATTPPDPAVVAAMAEVAVSHPGNPSSIHALGRAARARLDDAREFLRGSVGGARIVMTSGGTEADMLGILGAAAARPSGRVLVAASDHAAVLAQDGLLARHRQQLQLLPVTPHGDLDPEVLFENLGSDVRVVSLLHGHNELGTLCDLDELVGLIRRVAPAAHIHVDLVQAYGKIDFDLDLADVDSVATSAHKLHGPRGVGFLALSSKASLAPLCAGGGQEEGLRGGTENLAGAVGFALAAELALTHLERRATTMRALLDRAWHAIVEVFPDATQLGHPDRRLPHVLSVRIPGVIAHTLLERCDERGVMFSTGAACHAGETKDNHVLRAIGLSRGAAREVFRLSVAASTTTEELDLAVDVLLDEAEMLQHLAVPASRKANGHAQ
ncbi:MAG: cysteine desulfurase family protein [Planctomycetota bacterium]